MGTFAYGDSYWGLRAFDQTSGVVKDAAASTSATSSIAPVGFLNAIGAAASVSMSSSTTAAAESFVLKESPPYSYGTSSFGSHDFGQDYFDVPISATSSTSLTGATALVALRGATITASGQFDAIGGFLANVNGQVSASSGTTCGAVRYRTGTPNVAATSVATSASTANFISGAAISTTSVVAAVGEQVIIEESDRFTYGTSTWGNYAYGFNANLQTVAGAVSSASAAGIRIQAASASTTAAASTTADSEQIFQTSAQADASAATSVDAVFIYVGAAVPAASSDFDAQAMRIREVDTTAAGSLVTVALGRKKWETIADVSVTWNSATIESVTWNRAA